MGKYKINCREDNRSFVETRSYQRLLETFRELRGNGGKIIHVVGAPGTGKSANICAAQKNLGLNFYEVKLSLPSAHLNSRDVFNQMIKSIRDDLGINTLEKLSKYLKQFDAVVFADQFHDSHLLGNEHIGFSQWTDFRGLRTFNFYFLCILEYLRHRMEFRDINLVLQTAWRIRFGGSKKDIFTDLGPVSILALSLLKVPFNVVEISYSEKETISIVKNHISEVDDDLIRQYIKIHGYKPRFICQSMENRIEKYK
jgi:hypothetical protein